MEVILVFEIGLKHLINGSLNIRFFIIEISFKFANEMQNNGEITKTAYCKILFINERSHLIVNKVKIALLNLG
jgi:hypothetical protein